MKFEQAYGAVNNLIAEFESLIQLRPFLEEAKDVEKYIEDSKNEGKNLEDYIQNLREQVSKLENVIQERKNQMDLEEKNKIKEIKSQIEVMRDRATHEQSEKLQQLNSQISDKNHELNALNSAIEQKYKLNRELDEETSRRKHELKSVKDNLTAIKNSLGN